MKPYFHNCPGSKVFLPMEAASLRAAYVLTDEAILTETTGFIINISDERARPRQSYKIAMVLQSLERFPERKATMKGLIEAYKKIAKTKHRNAQQIRLMKETERTIDAHYADYLGHLAKGVQDLGFNAFKDIIGTGGLSFYCIDNANPELSGNNYTPASQLLQRMTEVPGEKDPEIFFLLPENVFPLCFSEAQTHYAPDDAAAGEPGNSWFEQIILMPSLNHLTAAELKEVRHLLRNPGVAFRTACDEWIAGSYRDDYGGSSLDFYKASVRPAAAEIAAAFMDNAIIAAYQLAATTDPRLGLWLGEMPAWQIWDCYEKAGVTKPVTASVLEPLKEQPAYQKKWPVMVLSISPDANQELTTARKDEESMLTPRKTLSID